MTDDPEQDERLTAYALGELAGDEAREVEAALAGNSQAARHVANLRGLAERVRTGLRAEPAEALAVGQRRAIEAAAAGPVVGRIGWSALAAGLLVAAGVGVWMRAKVDVSGTPPGQGVAVRPEREPDRPPIELPHPDFIGTAAPGDPLRDLPVELPQPAFIGTPKEVPKGVRMGKLTGHERGPYRLPGSIVSELTNVAEGRPVTSSDARPVIGELGQVTDGEKSYNDGHAVELAPGKQWVQIDLGREYENFAILIWHRFDDNNRVYRDVVVQVSSTPDFADARTVFNNDYDNTLGLGEGRDFEYFENHEGLLVPLYKPLEDRAEKFRYLRCWSRGSTSDDANHYTEVEIWGRPTG